MDQCIFKLSLFCASLYKASVKLLVPNMFDSLKSQTGKLNLQ